MEYLHTLSQRIGSGNIALDLAVLFVAALVFAAVMALEGAVQRKRERREAERFERVAGVAGRLEKLEKTLNNFRTDSLRSGELLRSELQHARADIAALVRASGGTPSAPPSSSEANEPGAGGEQQAAAPAEEPEPAPAAETAPLAPDEAREAEAAAEAEEQPEAPEALAQRLRRTRAGIWSQLRAVLKGSPKIDAAALEEIESHLIASDIGVKTVQALVEQAKSELKDGRSVTESSLLEELKARVRTILKLDAPHNPEIRALRRPDGPSIVMMVGVNGVGKTTTTAKLAAQCKAQGARVLMVAADTFRAAAVEQLVTWGEKIGVPVVHGAADAKPATVVFDAMERAKWESFDVVIIDTAGRLHTKSNLMQELEGVKNVIRRHLPSAPHEVLLVLDGSTGQNALSQAREFNQALSLTGLIVTKLDGTPRGGIVIAIKAELGIPVRYIGVGEGPGDLRTFVPDDFVNALFDFSDAAAPESSAPLSAHAETRRRKRRDSEGAIVH
jgi:fused signal recognition particle receptor